MFETLSFRVNLRPVESDEPYKETLDDSVATKDIQRFAPALGCEHDVSISRRPKQSASSKPLHHGCDGSLRQPKLLGQTDDAYLASPTEGLHRLEIVLHGLRCHLRSVPPAIPHTDHL